MPKETRYCTIGDCNDKHYAKGYCRKHYKKFIELPKRAANSSRTQKKNLIQERLEFMKSSHI